MTHNGDMTAAINGALDQFLATAPGTLLDLRAVAAELGVVPLVWDWEAFGALRLDGALVWVAYDPPHDMEPVTDEPSRNMMLHRAATRFAALRALQPIRPPDATDCSGCDGTGVPLGVAPHFNMTCRCGGLGWLPSASPRTTGRSG